MKKFFILIFLCSILHGQDDYQKWLKNENDKYQSFLTEQDKKFYDFLKKEWKEFKINDGLTREKEIKPINIPVIKPEPVIPKTQPESKKIPEAIINIPSIKPEIPDRLIENKKDDFNYSDFTYYNDIISVSYPKALMNIQLPEEINNEVIAEYWKRINSISLNDLLSFVQSQQKEKKLNDWGYFRYVWQLSNKINSDQYNESLLLTWFVLLKSGYLVKVGLIDKDLMLFVKSNELIFEIPYLKENNNQKTYLMNFKQSKGINGSLYTYDDDYPGSNKYLSLKINVSPNLKKVPVKRKMEFSFNRKNYVINATVNNNLIDYFKDYPGTQYDTFFKADVSNDIESTLLPVMKDYTKGMKEPDAVNFLLRFGQTAFGYKTDEENFGREKQLFVEETIFYPYSNCKDRAILFAYLIRKVLNLKVVGIEYPGHMAAAVALKEDAGNSYVMHNGIKYTICDPTYINANVGMSMPFHPVESIENIIDIN